MIKQGSNPSKGKIKTWSFMPKIGWKTRYDEEGFHSHTGFGYNGTLDSLATKVLDFVGTSPLTPWGDVIKAVPEVEFLIPSQANRFVEILRDKNVILGGGKISEIQECIGNIKHAN